DLVMHRFVNTVPHVLTPMDFISSHIMCRVRHHRCHRRWHHHSRFHWSSPFLRLQCSDVCEEHCQISPSLVTAICSTSWDSAVATRPRRRRASAQGVDVRPPGDCDRYTEELWCGETGGTAQSGTSAVPLPQ